MNDYIKRNQRWINPICVALMLVLSPILVQSVAVNSSAPGGLTLPTWLVQFGVVLAGFATTIGAMKTDTASARVVQPLGIAFAVLMILYYAFK